MVLQLPTVCFLHYLFLSGSSDRHLCKPILIILPVLFLAHSLVVIWLLLDVGLSHVLAVLDRVKLGFRELRDRQGLLRIHLIRVVVLRHFDLPLLVDMW